MSRFNAGPFIRSSARVDAALKSDCINRTIPKQFKQTASAKP
jgi:hypothetical protein